MNKILIQIAIAVGFLVFLITLTVGLLRDVPVMIALYRALMCWLLGSLFVSIFFRFFARILYNFIDDQRAAQAQAEKEEAEKKQAKPEGAPNRAK